MASDVATAYVQIIPSARGISGGIEQAIGGDAAVSSAGASIGGKLAGAIKVAITAAGIGAALGKALTEGAALEQSIGGVDTLFKDFYPRSPCGERRDPEAGWVGETEFLSTLSLRRATRK